jgi:hypothetical protein
VNIRLLLLSVKAEKRNKQGGFVAMLVSRVREWGSSWQAGRVGSVHFRRHIPALPGALPTAAFAVR